MHEEDSRRKKFPPREIGKKTLEEREHAARKAKLVRRAWQKRGEMEEELNDLQKLEQDTTTEIENIRCVIRNERKEIDDKPR